MVNGQGAAPAPDVAVRVQNLCKEYGKVKAVRGVSLEVRAGEIFGLIGPDGAGKTSTFQILGGVMAATSGEAQIFGRPARDARSEVGYLTQSFSLYPDLTVRENVFYVGNLRRVSREEIEDRAGRYLGMFDMNRFMDRQAGRLSGGMKQKLALACALVAQPKVLLLDEPTTGVDPVSRREFWDTLAHLAADGLTVVVATPYLDEAERCGRVALMYDGEIKREGTPAELRGSLKMKRLLVHTERLGEAEERLTACSGEDDQPIADVQRFGDRLDVMVRDAAKGRQTVEEQLGDLGELEIRESEPTLENTFVAELRSLGERVETPSYPFRQQDGRNKGEAAMEATDLSKTFGSFQAVKSVNVRIEYGEIYGLLGANGAGKTTTIKMLCGLIPASSGSMTLAGDSGSLRTQSVRQKIGYMSQKFSLYDDLTIGGNLDFFAGVYGVPEDQREEKKKWVLEFSGLTGKQNQITGSLPGGWKQRVAFGASILHEPQVLFLDEPTSGVDPLARRAFWRMINQLADRGTAILVTTHYLEEAEQCNRLGLMVAGELVAEGTPSGIKKEQGGHLLELIVDQPQKASDLLKNEKERWRVSLFGDRLHVITGDDLEAEQEQTLAALRDNGIEVREVREETYSLEDVFIVVVEKARAEGKAASDD